MDGRGRLAQPLKGSGVPARPAAAAPGRQFRLRTPVRVGRIGRHRTWLRRLTGGSGIAVAAMVVAAGVGYGAIAGGHVQPLIAAFKDARDLAANAAGFRIANVAFTGQKHIGREEILARAGISGTTSLLFLDVADARARLMTDPRIADATILKLYPDRLQIAITERVPFALWQKDGRISVIADDGSVLQPYVTRPFVKLPLVVGAGAEKRAKEFLALLDKYPEVRARVRASILVAERRWNLRLDNGLDVKLPETGVDAALAKLDDLDRQMKLTTRDIVALDLRLSDRVVVRLSDAAAQAREAANKEKAKAKKGGSA